MAEGRQINLDEGEGTILEGYAIDDIYSPCSYITLTFECSQKLTFGADVNYYLTYCNIDWVPMSFSEKTGTNKMWHYEMCCCPKAVFKLITKPCKNTQELARALDLNLSNLSDNLELPCPIINQRAGNVIHDERFYSLEKAYRKNQLGEAAFIYASTKELFTSSWKKICSQTAIQLKFPSGTEGTNLPIYQDYQFDSLFTTANGPDIWKQKDYIGKMIGTQFKIETTVPAFFLNLYTIKFEDIPEFDTGLPFLCIYSKRDLVEVNAFTNYFANIKYVK